MNPRFVLGLVLILLAATAVSAHDTYAEYQDIENLGQTRYFAPHLHEIFNDGNYYDLLDLRRDTRRELLPWIDSYQDWYVERRRLFAMHEDRHDRVEETKRLIRRERSRPTYTVYQVHRYHTGPSNHYRYSDFDRAVRHRDTNYGVLPRRYVQHARVGDHRLHGHYSLRHHYSEH